MSVPAGAHEPEPTGDSGSTQRRVWAGGSCRDRPAGVGWGWPTPSGVTATEARGRGRVLA
ncbi:hypothetical protein PSMK_02300 [Phycisphaera mikurensis NBRC 102666]|uniref:Uncharacterized protein n=1 Tax=Phycisphaera mikurensis (strain NBRC 102666 / KCTC 22515 / FYK2301M01) TaxID=1142394 RepID=I0IAV1_PHYMF|nr:hypothetical protein PSMK_02300 [Phycisphaera mikurensis NBRC 102666]